MKTRTIFPNILLASMLILAGCTAIPALKPGLDQANAVSSGPTPLANQPTQLPTSPAPLPPAPGAIAAIEGTLENIYATINPSVVNIQVRTKASGSSTQLPQLPFDFQFPNDSNPSAPQMQTGLGSGFIWDTQGHIITNNHVVDGAEEIMVTFSDGRMFSAKIVGADPDADLAVILINAPAEELQPLVLGDSEQVKVGQLAVAIGNPFGLSGTMTVGFISALDRSLDVDPQTVGGATYTIPDVIQTDAPINPGNSGGVLVNDQGQVIGVTAAIESPVRGNAGIGFVIPSNIVQRVVPELIQNGKFEHTWLGISGTTLTPLAANAMKLDEDQRGILVIDVTPGSPAEKAGLSGSDSQVEIDGSPTHIGGDVVISVDGEKLTRFDDLVSFLFQKGSVGQEISLTILRNGKEQIIKVALAARPASGKEPLPDSGKISDQAWMGIQGADLSPEIASAMDLDKDQNGVLIEQVIPGSPAADAGLLGSSEPLTLQGKEVQVGGDVITAVNGKPISSMIELKGMISTAAPGDRITLSILRDAKETEIEVKLAALPTGQP
jgi:serine protease Do